jgi:hypothetical protein
MYRKWQPLPQGKAEFLIHPRTDLPSTRRLRAQTTSSLAQLRDKMYRKWQPLAQGKAPFLIRPRTDLPSTLRLRELRTILSRGPLKDLRLRD